MKLKLERKNGFFEQKKKQRSEASIKLPPLIMVRLENSNQGCRCWLDIYFNPDEMLWYVTYKNSAYNPNIQMKGETEEDARLGMCVILMHNNWLPEGWLERNPIGDERAAELAAEWAEQAIAVQAPSALDITQPQVGRIMFRNFEIGLGKPDDAKRIADTLKNLLALELYNFNRKTEEGDKV